MREGGVGITGHNLADCVDWLAAITGQPRRPAQAALLFGAADAQWKAAAPFAMRPTGRSMSATWRAFVLNSRPARSRQRGSKAIG